MASVDDLVGKLLGDLGAALGAALVAVGDELGLYRSLAATGGATADELARDAGIDGRYAREWLSAQAAAGYVDYDAATDRFSLNDAQRLAFAEPDSPAHFLGGFEIARSLYSDLPKLIDAFRTGRGVGWHEHDAHLFCGTERFFRPGYVANLATSWIPALDGVEERLARGGRIADVGCGHGASTLLMARAYPDAEVVGFDYHAPSVAAAARAAEAAGLSDRVRFEVASAKEFGGDAYDLVCIFDALHDMGDPVGAARHIREALAPGGTWMLVEPMAGDRLEDNLNPVGRVYYAASTLICTPASRAQEVGLALGAQAGPRRLEEVVREAGFTHFREATRTPVNLVFEVRG